MQLGNFHTYNFGHTKSLAVLASSYQNSHHRLISNETVTIKAQIEIWKRAKVDVINAKDMEAKK